MVLSNEPGNANEKDFLNAFGDNTRRTILDLLAERDEMTVTQISKYFPILVRSGISKHLMQLRKLNLVHSKKRGREQFYSMNSEVFKSVLEPWIKKYEKYWSGNLIQLKQTAERSNQNHTK